MHRDGSTTRAMGPPGVESRAIINPGTAASHMPSAGACRSIAATSRASSSVATSALPADRPRLPRSVYPRRVATFTAFPPVLDDQARTLDDRVTAPPGVRLTLHG